MVSLTVVIMTFVIIFTALYFILRMNGPSRLHHSRHHHPHRKMPENKKGA